MYAQFAGFVDGYTVEIMDRAIAAGISASLGYMRGALMLLTVLAAFLCWTRKLDAWWVARRGMLAMIALALLEAGTYGSMVRDTFWTTLPNLAASAVSGHAVGITTAERFDAVHAAAAHVVALADARAGGYGLTAARAGVGIGLAEVFIKLFNGVSFALVQIARTATALLISAGPFLLVAFIFDATRGWVVSWFAKLVSLAVWSLCSMLLGEMLLSGAMMWTQETAANSTAGAAAVVDGLWKLAVWMMLNAAILAGLPYYAAFASDAAFGPAAAAASMRRFAQKHALRWS